MSYSLKTINAAKLAVIAVICSLYIPAFSQHNTVAIKADDTPAQILKKAVSVVPATRQLNWQKLERTAFIHFGINTFTGREWGTGTDNIALFNPTQLNTTQWVSVLKNAGFTQIVFTAKHHDGFCLWPSAYTRHSIKHTPYMHGNGDVVKQLADACHKAGMKFGLYLSPWDRNSPYYGQGEPYNNFFVNQLTELLTHYGKVDEMWFDGANGEGPNGKKQVYDFPRIYATIRRLQPQCIIANMGPDARWVGTESGYGRLTEWSVTPVNNLSTSKIAGTSQTTENFTPVSNLTSETLGSRQQIYKATGLAWYPAETDVSIRPGWFYHAEEDSKVKSPEKLFDIYKASVGRNGVLLLNVPPDRRGLIHENDADSLLKLNEIINNTFSNNLLKNAAVTYGAANIRRPLTDERLITAATINPAVNGVINIKFTRPTVPAYLVLQEDIARGQRAEAFQLQAYYAGKWNVIAQGTTIGYKRIIDVPSHTAPITLYRLVITQSRAPVYLAALGLYAAAY